MCNCRFCCKGENFAYFVVNDNGKIQMTTYLSPKTQNLNKNKPRLSAGQFL